VWLLWVQVDELSRTVEGVAQEVGPKVAPIVDTVVGGAVEGARIGKELIDGLKQ